MAAMNSKAATGERTKEHLCDANIGKFMRRITELLVKLRSGVLSYEAVMDCLAAVLEHPEIVLKRLREGGYYTRDELNYQISKLLAIEPVKPYEQLGMTRAAYKRELGKAVGKFMWRPELALQGLDRVAIVDYRIYATHSAALTSMPITANGLHDFLPVERNGIRVIQGQWGKKYIDLPFSADPTAYPNQRPITLEEGLFVAFYESFSKRGCNMILGWTRSDNGSPLIIEDMNGDLFAREFTARKDPKAGLATVGN